MATVHEPSPKVRTEPERKGPEQKEPEQKVKLASGPAAKDKERLRSDRIHAAIVLVVVVAVFALIILLATLSPPPEGAEFKPWIMP